MSEEQQKPSEPSDLQWAEDVQRVYRHLGQIITTDNIEGSKSARALHDWVMADLKHESTFLTTMSQKALEIIQKYRKNEQDDRIETMERKTILDLKLRLAEAVEESESVEP